MSAIPPPGTEEPPALSGWLAVAAVAFAALVIGFAGGWVLRGDGEGITVPDGATPVETPAPEAEVAQTAPVEPLAARSMTRLVVLNGSGVAGAASTLAETAEAAGYEDVPVGDTARTDGPSVVYHRSSPRLANRVARDLGLDVVAVRPEELTEAADADVVVVLGSG